MSRLEGIINGATRWLNWVAAAALLAVMVVVCGNVVGRGFWEKPIKGTVEIVSLLGTIVIGWAIAYTQVLKGHIRVDLLLDRLPARAQHVVDSVIGFISFALFVIISWQTVIFARGKYQSGELSEVLKFTLTPFALAVGIGCIALTCVLLLDFIKSVRKVLWK